MSAQLRLELDDAEAALLDNARGPATRTAYAKHLLLNAIRGEELQRIIAIASQLGATIPADHPKGAQASFADYLRVTNGGRG